MNKYMSNYNLKARNRKTGDIVEFIALDNYYGHGKYGYDQAHSTISIVLPQKGFDIRYEVIEDLNHPYGGLEVLDNVPPETMEDRFNKEFVDENTGMLNISKYDHKRLLEFIKNEIKNNE